MAQVEIFYGSLVSSAGAVFKSLQMVSLPDLDKMKSELNQFISREDIEVISISHQFNDGILSVLVYYRSK